MPRQQKISNGVKKILPWLVLVILAILIGTTLLIKIDRFTKSISYSSEIILPEKKTISVVLVGDIMLDRGVEYMIEKYGGGDFKFPFSKIADYLNKADIVFGNLEGPISDKGIKVGSIYSFRAEPKAIEGLKFAGFNVLSIANNHTLDYGKTALEDTLLRLKEAEIDPVGIDSPIIKEIKNTKIGFLAYTNLGSPYWGISWADWDNLEEIEKEIKETKEKSDILIVSLHAGEEYQKEPTQFQIDFSKMAIEAGADVVVGHHPHVVQESKKYPSTSSGQAGWIFYSLGNFVFDQSFSKETMQGKIVKVLIKNGKIENVIPIDIKINSNFQPEIK